MPLPPSPGGAEKVDGSVAERRRKLASYVVAGSWNDEQRIIRPGGTGGNDRRIPLSLPDTIPLRESPDTLCLANFQLSRWDERDARPFATQPPWRRETEKLLCITVPLHLGAKNYRGLDAPQTLLDKL